MPLSTSQTDDSAVADALAIAYGHRLVLEVFPHGHRGNGADVEGEKSWRFEIFGGLSVVWNRLRAEITV